MISEGESHCGNSFESEEMRGFQALLPIAKDGSANPAEDSNLENQIQKMGSKIYKFAHEKVKPKPRRSSSVKDDLLPSIIQTESSNCLNRSDE